MNYIYSFDFGILNFIYENFHTDFLDSIIPVITSWGNGGKIWILLSVVLIIFPKTRKAGIAALLALAIEFVIVNLFLKDFVARIRPYNINTAVNLLINPPHDYSFPSGHTGSSFAAATAIYCFNRKIGIPALILATAIGLSRLYLYVHFPTDVLAGALIGIFVGIVVSKIIKKKADNNKLFRRIK